jgi:hypothetical protein
MKHEAVEAFCPRPFDYPLDKEDGDTLTTPLRLSEHIDDNRVPSFSDANPLLRAGERVRQDFAKLNPGPAGDDVRVTGRTGQPSDIFATREEVLEAVTRFRPQRFKCFRWDLAHFVEHACAMFGDGVSIIERGKSGRESV